MHDIAFESASMLAAAIHNKSLKSRDLLEHLLQRIDRFNGPLNAIVTLDSEQARQRADLADAALARGEYWGPLHGLPITIKDGFQTLGLRTTGGALPYRDHVPNVNAVAVQRLIDAGAIVFGKTNLPAFSVDMQTYNPVFGTTNNPWDLARTSGGSSGGSAAALAAGLTPLDLAADRAGSIRLPAHYCGVYGHKPSYGLVPLRGYIPGPPGTLTEPDIAVAGPMARCPADLALALDLLAGPNAEQACAWKLQLPRPRHNALRRFRVAAWFDDDAFPLDDGIRKCYQAVLDALRDHDVAVDESARPAFEFMQARDMFIKLMLASKSPAVPLDAFEELIAQASRNAPDDPDVDAEYARCTTMRHREWILVNEARLRMGAAWASFFRNYDVLLCPIAPIAAHVHDQSEPQTRRTIIVNGKPQPYLSVLNWPGVIGVARLPATAAPVGFTDEGLPVGMQIVGPYLEDHTPIAFAGMLADIVGGFKAPPGY